MFVTGSYQGTYFEDNGFFHEMAVQGFDVDVSLNGNLDVEARANGGNLGFSADARALAVLTGEDITINGDVTVMGSATGHGFTYHLHTYDGAERSHTADGVFGQASLFVAGRATLASHDFGARGNDFSLDGSAESVRFKGNVLVKESADGNRLFESSYDEAVAGTAEFSVDARTIELDKSMNVTAYAGATSVDGYVEAHAFAALESGDDLGFVTVKGPITVTASASGNNLEHDFASYRAVEAFAGLDIDGTLMQVTNINVAANARGIRFEDVRATADGSLGDSSLQNRGALHVTGGINVTGNAVGTDVGSVDAFGGIQLYAESITVAGPVRAAGKAQGNDVFSTHDGSGAVRGEGSIHANGGNLFFGASINAIGRADVLNTFDGHGASYARAEAKVNLEAHGSLVIFPPYVSGPGIVASAMADTEDNADKAWAGAFIQAHAATASYNDGPLGTGEVFIKGNMTAHAVAIGTDTGMKALAFQNITGQNVTIIGNIVSRAFADGTNDSARAGVAIDADIIPDSGDPHHGSDANRGVLLIIGDVPIASAIAGTAHAFRQAAYSTEQSATGQHGSHAFADIDIEGSEAVVLTPTTDQQLRLLTLETLLPNPPWASSSLSEILLTIQDHKCGALGGAGNPKGTNQSCEKRPFHIADTDVDTLP